MDLLKTASDRTNEAHQMQLQETNSELLEAQAEVGQLFYSLYFADVSDFFFLFFFAISVGAARRRSLPSLVRGTCFVGGAAQ